MPFCLFGLSFLFIVENAPWTNLASTYCAIAIAAYKEMSGKGVYRFGADSIEADRKLENIIVVLGASIDLADAFDRLCQEGCRVHSRGQIL